MIVDTIAEKHTRFPVLVQQISFAVPLVNGTLVSPASGDPDQPWQGSSPPAGLTSGDCVMMNVNLSSTASYFWTVIPCNRTTPRYPALGQHNPGFQKYSTGRWFEIVSGKTNGNMTYQEARLLCKAYGADLADTYGAYLQPLLHLMFHITKAMAFLSTVYGCGTDSQERGRYDFCDGRFYCI